MNENANTSSAYGPIPTRFQHDDFKSFSWSDISETSTILPQFETESLALIDCTLGYRPHRSVTLPFEISIRALMNSHRYGLISDYEFSQQIEGYVKLIRNEDLIPDSEIDYDQHIYNYYWNSFQPYGDLTRERIKVILGVEPDLRHSVTAEIWLREFIALDIRRNSDELTSAEVRALTIIRYRQVLLKKGKQAADVSAIPFQQLTG